MLTGCFSKKGTNPRDPFESYNRKVYAFNQAVNEFVWNPAATFYRRFTPWPLYKGINNAFNNLYLMPTVANDLLQFELAHAFQDTGRFIINSSIGIFGLFDVAKHMGIKPHYNDMGLTFRKWGDKNSPYMEVPIFGPSTMAWSYGLTFDYALFTIYPHIKPISVRRATLGLLYLQTRANLLETEQFVDKAALDPYAFQRDAFLQYRDSLFQNHKTEQ